MTEDIRELREDIRNLDKRTYDLQSDIGDVKQSVARIEGLVGNTLRTQHETCAVRGEAIRDLRTDVAEIRRKTAEDKSECITLINDMCKKFSTTVNNIEKRQELHEANTDKHYKDPSEEGAFAYVRRRPFWTTGAGLGGGGMVAIIAYIIAKLMFGVDLPFP